MLLTARRRATGLLPWFVFCVAASVGGGLAGSLGCDAWTSDGAPRDAAASAGDAAADERQPAQGAVDPAMLRAQFAEYRDSTLPASCEIGVPSDEGYAPLDAGGTIPIMGRGQSGLVAILSVRVLPDADPEAPPIDQANIELVLTNLDSGVIAESKPWGEVVPLECIEDGCYRSNILVEISHLAKLPELEGTEVGVDVRLLSDDGEALCHARSYGVLEQD